MNGKQKNIFDFTPDELEREFVKLRLQPFKARLVCNYLFKKGLRSFREMSFVGSRAVELIERHFTPGSLNVKGESVDTDGSVKFLLEAEDGAAFECVLMPDDDRISICVSVQSGCPLRCVFCATGLMGFRRNLKASEMIEQVYIAQCKSIEQYNRSVTNVVFMGMGEPMLNLSQVVRAIEIISSEKAFQISPRKITVSTVGIPGKMKEFVTRSRANLAVSLHAPDDERRRKIMPSAAEMYSIQELMDELKELSGLVRRLITLEYLLIRDFNDSEEDAERFAHLIDGFRCKVNLIPYNEVEWFHWKSPDDIAVRRFQKVLLSHGVLTTVRESKAREVNGACGQLGISFLRKDHVQLEGFANNK